MALYIGLMSGTSLDGVDGVLAELAPQRTASLAHVHEPFSPGLRAELLALNSVGANELHRAALAANAVVDSYAAVVPRLLTAAGVVAADVDAIGAHGQTVRHRPGEFDPTGYTLQLMNGALLAERCGIDVVCDFRSRDVAAGGQGAPLVPAFHAERFGVAGRDVAVLNLGGIANLTLLSADGNVRGFDCGPGNVLLDAWCSRHLGTPYDDGGQWAAAGRVDAGLLARLAGDPFFALAPPKSTGRDLFNADWLARHVMPSATAQDVMATLAELTVAAAGAAIGRHAPATSLLLVCGGGAFNAHLMRRLAATLPAAEVRSTAAVGVPPDQVEALAFGWLARAFRERRAGNVPAVTGASAARVLGALYPA